MKSVAVAVAAMLLVVSGMHHTSAQGVVLFGSYSPSSAVFTALNQWLSYKNQSVSIIEVGWAAPSNLPTTFASVQAIWASNAVPVITWMPYGYINWTSPTPNDDIVNGVYDAYIDAFYTSLSSFLAGNDNRLGTSDDRRAYLRFAPQPNGDWFPWSPYCPSCSGTGQHIQQTAHSYRAMFDYVIGKARTKYQLTADQLQVMWCVNDGDVSGPMESFYPSASLVDWTGIVGFNWGTSIPGNTWTDPSALFMPPLNRLRQFASTKPVALATVASTSTPNGVPAKNKWIGKLFKFVATQPEVHMLAFHNADGATDFAVFGGANGDVTVGQYMAYSAVLTNVQKYNWLVGSDAANALLISNKAFAGSNSTPVPPPGPTTAPPAPTPPATPPPPNPNCPCDTADTRAALQELYDSTGGPQWSNKADWLSSAPICNWYGIGCPASNPFLTITLNDIRLNGNLPDWGTHPTFLSLVQYLDLDDNAIGGTLPAAWSGMNNVQVLLLFSNQLTGELPSSWSGMVNITDFQVDWNKLSGTLPNWMSGWQQLQYLTLDFNYFTGPFPSAWCPLQNLMGVQVCGNSAFGSETNKFCGNAPACYNDNDTLNATYTQCLPSPNVPLPWC